MIRSYSIGRFIGPLLAFAALSGICTGFTFGALVTIFGLAIGLFTFAAELPQLLKAAMSLAHAFPNFALFVLGAIALGTGSGFITGAISALIGDKVGHWWSLACVIAFSILILPQFYHGVELAPALIASAFGALLPFHLMALNPERYEWAEKIGKWLRGTWLVNPPQIARCSGILLPILLYGLWEINLVAPEFVQHPNYAARLGNWMTWQNSRRLAVNKNGYRRSSCQSSLKQILLGIQQYVQDYDEKYPAARTDPAHGTMEAIYPYLKSTYIFQCPSEFYSYGEGKFASGDFTDYWFNARLYGVPEAKFSHSANTITCGDGNTGAGEANSAYSLRSLPIPFAPAQRHSGTANYAFADGHVKATLPSTISNTVPPSAGSTFVP